MWIECGLVVLISRSGLRVSNLFVYDNPLDLSLSFWVADHGGQIRDISKMSYIRPMLLWEYPDVILK